MIRRLLVANRGEIARRVFRTCRDTGIETVAVHSDADAAMPFVREADLAVRLPGNAPGETYLRADLIVAAARQAGADAVHPGYGFLSENPDFARTVVDAGLTWVGPTPESMEQMASKVQAKKLMAAAGVPVLAALDAASITEADLPVLVKASAGGGGRGMRVVRDLGRLDATLESAANEAASAFGDPAVFCEPYVERGRHIEVQVVGDLHGDLAVFGERDCSIQRRHQKVVEETPAPGIGDDVRRGLHAAARTAAEAVGYVGAGTVEFLYDPASQRFYFLEMNTRLQVEHPVTECVWGIDLVALQISVAEGRRLSDLGAALQRRPGGSPDPRGHAVEVRLYAEDPAADWQPQSGRLARFDVAGVDARFASPPGYGVRVDSGVEAGDEVTTFYDAMIAKVVSWAPTREEACRRLAAALRRARIHGLRTNRDLLAEILTHPRFLAGDVSTAFLGEEDIAALQPAPPLRSDGADQALPLFAAAVAVVEEAGDRRPVQRRVPHGWRNVVSGPQVVAFDSAGTRCEVGWLASRDGYVFVDRGGVVGGRAGPAERIDGGWRVPVERDGVRTAYEVFVDRDGVDVEGPGGHVSLTTCPRFVDPADQVAEGSLLAPMPGSVVAVHARQGEEVTGGQAVLVLEAMKMQHTVAAPYPGVVTEVPVAVGDQVTAGAVLAVVSASPTGGTPHSTDNWPGGNE